MSTPRKRWFKVADKILREEWDDATLATVMRLCAWLNQRYARDAIPPEEAGNAKLFVEDSMAITRVRSSARRSFSTLVSRLKSADLETLELQLVDRGSHSYCQISWPKFPIFQEYGSRSRGESPDDDRPGEGAHPTPAPISGSDSGLQNKKPPVSPKGETDGPEQRKLIPDPEPPAKREPVKTIAPEELPPDDLAKLEDWCRRKRPAELPFLPEHIEACLDHFRGTRVLRAEWWRSCRTWVRNARKYEKTQRPGEAPRMAEPRKQTPEEIRRAARALRDDENERSAYGD